MDIQDIYILTFQLYMKGQEELEVDDGAAEAFEDGGAGFSLRGDELI